MAGDQRDRPIHRYFLAQHFLLFCVTVVGVAGARVAYGPVEGKHTTVTETAVVMQTIVAVVQVPTTTYCLLRCSGKDGLGLIRERYMLIASLVALPCVLLADAYVACVAFLGPGDESARSPVAAGKTAVLRNALMTLLPDVVVLVGFFWAGARAKLAETDPEKVEQVREGFARGVQAEMDAEKIERAVERERVARERAGDGVEGEP